MKLTHEYSCNAMLDRSLWTVRPVWYIIDLTVAFLARVLLNSIQCLCSTMQ